MNALAPYLKAAGAVAATVLTALIPFLIQGGTLSQAEIDSVIIVALGACVVFTAPNIPGHEYVKGTVAVLTAAAVTLHTFLIPGGIGAVTAAQWAQVALAVLSALGVGTVLPNTPPVTPGITSIK